MKLILAWSWAFSVFRSQRKPSSHNADQKKKKSFSGKQAKKLLSSWGKPLTASWAWIFKWQHWVDVGVPLVVWRGLTTDWFCSVAFITELFCSFWSIEIWHPLGWTAKILSCLFVVGWRKKKGIPWNVWRIFKAGLFKQFLPPLGK